MPHLGAEDLVSSDSQHIILVLFARDAMSEQTDFRQYLQQELLRRCDHNSAYSLRAFARSLDIDHSTLSQILRNKRKISQKTFENLCSKLGLGPEEVTQFKKPWEQNTTSAKQPVRELKKLHQLTFDTFSVISDWYHHVLLELPRLKSFKPDIKWAAKVLGIKTTQVRDALERLERVGLIDLSHEGEWRVLSQDNEHLPMDDYTHVALKKLQKQVLEMGKLAVDDIPLAQRCNRSVIMAFDSSNIDTAIDLIDQFRKEFASKVVDQDGSFDHVYQLGIAFYPVTER